MTHAQAEPFYDETLTLAKGIGIVLIVLGHCPTPLTDLLYSFHVPLFFVLGGWLAARKGNTDRTLDFMRQRFRQLMIPYFVIGLGSYLLWLGLRPLAATTQDIQTPIYKPLLGLLYGNGEGNWLIFNTPLWFLPCFFLVSGLFVFLWRRLMHQPLLFGMTNLLLASVGWFLSLQPIKPPWGFDLALMALPFFHVGFILCQSTTRPDGNKVWSVVILMGFVLFVLGNSLNSIVDVNQRIFGNPILYFLTAIAGSSVVLGLARTIAGLKPLAKGLSLLGQQAMPIFALHMLVFRLISVLIVKGFSSDPEVFMTHFWPVYFVAGIGLPLGIGLMFPRPNELKN
jgi:fucose 4-O-acetylase-like acetyltransferase